MVRGGMLISRFRIWPRLTASRCSQSRPMCQLSSSGVSGSTIGHACLMNSWRLFSAISLSIRSSGGDCNSSVSVPDDVANALEIVNR